MMKRDWDLLFSEYDLRAVLENQKEMPDHAVLKLVREVRDGEW